MGRRSCGISRRGPPSACGGRAYGNRHGKFCKIKTRSARACGGHIIKKRR